MYPKRSLLEKIQVSVIFLVYFPLKTKITQLVKQRKTRFRKKPSDTEFSLNSPKATINCRISETL